MQPELIAGQSSIGRKSFRSDQESMISMISQDRNGPIYDVINTNLEIHKYLLIDVKASHAYARMCLPQLINPNDG